MARPDEPVLDCSEAGLRRSYTALLLSLPALICLLAAERANSGFSDGAGLFSDPMLAVAVVLAAMGSILAVPAMLLALVPELRWQGRLAAFIVAWNWAGLVSAHLFAVPAALYAIGWSNPGIAVVHGLGFATIVARLRYSAARSAFGAGRGVAWLVVTMSVLVDYAVLSLFGLWGF